MVSTGWFTTLTPKRWFAVSRLSGDFGYPVSHAKGASRRLRRRRKVQAMLTA